jgi:hypothetical protein
VPTLLWGALCYYHPVAGMTACYGHVGTLGVNMRSWVCFLSSNQAVATVAHLSCIPSLDWHPKQASSDSICEACIPQIRPAIKHTPLLSTVLFYTFAAKDSGCYSKCFCTSVKKAVAVLRQANIDRKGPSWSACMKQTWSIMVVPRVPRQAINAWKQQSCKSTQQCRW